MIKLIAYKTVKKFYFEDRVAPCHTSICKIGANFLMLGQEKTKTCLCLHPFSLFLNIKGLIGPTAAIWCPLVLDLMSYFDYFTRNYKYLRDEMLFLT